MLPTILARQMREGLSDYINTTFPITNPVFAGSIQRMLDSPGAVFHPPYTAVRLPFRVADTAEQPFESIHLPFSPYLHQQRAFERLNGEEGKSTLIATGTGSGKTECFLYPVLEYCYRHRGEKGIKAILVYPMNALAADQARRIAAAIHDSPQLWGNVTAGMFVGGQDGKRSPAMGPSNLITDRETMRSSPPDILLTNYKMLDYLLVRPQDAALWKDNAPSTLKFMVVDELHTFDGAQGTDLACLIRRLKARLGTPEKHLVCVGTSATMGGAGSQGPMLDFAGKVFGEPFEEAAVITEDRLSAAEFFAGCELEDFSLPNAEQVEELIRLAGEDELAAYVNTAQNAWLASPLQQHDLLGDEARLELGQRLMHHVFLQDALALMGDSPWQAEELIDHLRLQYPDLLKLRHPEAALESLFALVSHARIGQAGKLRPFLTVQVQLWLRELSRVVATVGGSQDIRFYVHNDLKEEEAAQALPVINCRDCGETGWVSAANERGCYRLDDLSTFYNMYFRPSDKSRVEMLYPFVEDGNPVLGFMKNRLCPKCLHLASGDGVPVACRVCDNKETIPVLTPLQQDASSAGGSKQYACPFCGSPGGLSLIGVRSPTAISVSLSQLFASRFNDDKKTMSFSDNVQDAAHRAGFFNARTWRFGFRGAVQRYVMDGGEGLSLADFQEGFWAYYQKNWSIERLVGNLIAPNLVWMRGYRDMLKTGKLGQGKEAQDLMKTVKQRAAYEIMLEYGISSRVGRTLEKSSASTLAFDAQALHQAANRTRERALSELGAFYQTDETTFLQMALGVLRIIRQSGAFEDSAFDMFLKEDGKSYFLTNDFRKWLPGKSAGRNVPRFPYDNNGRDIKTFDRITGPKYTSWLKTCTPELFIGEELFSDLSQILFVELYKAGFLVNVSPPHMGAICALDKHKVYVTADVRQFACDACQSLVPIAGTHAHDWAGAPCPRRKCGGKLHPSEGLGLNYYNRLYSYGDLVRINAREHTGLLDRSDREALEEDFKRSAGPEMPWMPNVLSCTPTLEMGIDIGDLSTVIMGSIPPGQAQYFQRSGRAGRKDGNALTMAVANSQAHDLYFYANPREMLQGEVSPPTVFLQASAVLERQFTAYCMDNWIRQGVPETAVPKNVSPCFNAIGKQNKNAFPQNFLSYVQDNLGGLFKGFLHLFQDQIDEETRKELDRFAFGQGLGGSPMHIRVLEAFAAAKNQCDTLSAGVREINKQIKTLKSKPQDSSYEEQIKELEVEKRALAEVIRSIKGKDVFNFLTDEGLLPNYAFPEAGITLKAVLRQSQDEENEAIAGRRKRRNQVYEYSRAAASAISEFAPMNNFYVEGRKLSINQVDLASAEIEKWRLCPSCTHAAPQEMNTAIASCPRCGSPGWADAGQLRTMLKLSQVYSHDNDRDSLIGDDSDNRSHVFFTRQLLVDVDEEHDVHKAYRMNNEDFAFGYEYVKKATMREINFGESDIQGETLTVANMERVRKGFHICKHCGYLQHGKRPQHSYACKTRTMPTLLADAYEPCLFLYREFVTEALRILVPATTLDTNRQRIESFVAAFHLGMKKVFGNVDHLDSTVMEVPVPGADYYKNYLVIYDKVPGGTGYLKQMMQNENEFLRVLEAALKTLENCSCREIEGRDGCYRCLFAYRQSRNIGQISRKTAMQLLQTILSGKDNLERVSGLAGIHVNATVESELERRFIVALERTRFQGQILTIDETMVNGKEGYYLKVGENTWLIEPQVRMDETWGVSIASRADFVLWPQRGNEGKKPVAIFTDGAQFHTDTAADDTLKRTAILESGNFRLFSFSYKDIQSVFDAQIVDYATPTLVYQNYPESGMYLPSLANQSTSLKLGQSTPLELLAAYLSIDQAEDVFKDHARAVGFSLVNRKSMKEEAIYLRWQGPAMEAAEALNKDISHLRFGHTFCEAWHPHPVNPHLAIYTSIDATQKRDRKGQADILVQAVLNDDPEGRGTHFGQELNALWQFANLMQFSSHFSAVTIMGMAAGLYHSIVPPSESLTQVDNPWADTFELLSSAAQAVAEALAGKSIPPPSSVGFELWLNGLVVAEAEMAWESRKIAFLLSHQVDSKTVFEEAGWHIFTDESSLNEALFAGG